MIVFVGLLPYILLYKTVMVGSSLHGYVAIATNFMYVYVLLNVGDVTLSVHLVTTKTVT